MKATILLTGGSGFIGSHLADALLNDGYRVRVLDRRPPATVGVEWIDGDLMWLGDCERAARGADVVIHLAARIEGGESVANLSEYFQGNVTVTLNILQACIANQVSRFIHTSSGEVYGNITIGKATESSRCDPISPYAASKYAAERAVLSFSRTFGLPVTVLRPFNTFGERQKPFRKGSAIPTFIAQSLREEPLRVFGKGAEVRDFLYVRDLISAHISVLEAKVPSQAVFNVASGRGRSMLEVAETVLEETGSKSELEFVSDSSDASRTLRSVGDSSLLVKSTRWKPMWGFREALKRVIEHYKVVGVMP